MSFFRLDNKWLIWPLFLFMMTYVVLRALFVEPLFDELATLYWYIQTGFLPGRGATMDANNHVLNSLISHQLYRLFGDHFFVYRLFAIFTFPLYFFSAKNLLIRASLRGSLWIFLALISVHWIIDYFSFSRGYGQSLAFLLLSFSLIQQWNNSFKSSYFIGIVFSFICALLCNLSLFIPLIILFFYLLTVSVSYRKKLIWTQKITVTICLLLFAIFLIPVYIYLNKLKIAGAFWWGSESGFWEVTGKSISKTIFFTENSFIRVLILLLLLGAIIHLIVLIKRFGIKSNLLKAQFWIPALLLLILCSLQFCSIFLKINYPMDRVGMYLVPLVILSYGIIVQTTKYLYVLIYLLCWFPLSFLWKMNLNTSIFSPEDRIHTFFYEKVKSHLHTNQSISADYVSQASYAYLTRSEKVPHIASNYDENDSLSMGTFHLSWVDKLTLPQYTCILRDSISGTRLYKKNSEKPKKLVFDTLIDRKQVSNQFEDLVVLKVSNYRSIQMNAIISGEITLQTYSLNLNLRTELISDSSQVKRIDNTRFDWYFGRKKNYQFHYPMRSFMVSPTDEFMRIRLVNDDIKSVTVKQLRIQLFTEAN